MIYRGCNAPFARAAGLSTSDEVVGKSDHDLCWTADEAEAYRGTTCGCWRRANRSWTWRRSTRAGRHDKPRADQQGPAPRCRGPRHRRAGDFPGHHGAQAGGGRPARVKSPRHGHPRKHHGCVLRAGTRTGNSSMSTTKPVGAPAATGTTPGPERLGGVPGVPGTAFECMSRQSEPGGVASDSYEECYAPPGLWLSVHSYPSPEGLSVYFHDITTRRKPSRSATGRTALLASEQRLRLALESGRFGSFDLDLTTGQYPEISGHLPRPVRPGRERRWRTSSRWSTPTADPENYRGRRGFHERAQGTAATTSDHAADGGVFDRYSARHGR